MVKSFGTWHTTSKPKICVQLHSCSFIASSCKSNYYKNWDKFTHTFESITDLKKTLHRLNLSISITSYWYTIQ